MSELKIIIAPDDRLIKVSKPIKEINSQTFSFLDDMLITMYQNNGIGLAAPQVGRLERLIVMDCSSDKTKPSPYKFINPEILFKSEILSEFEEGCLSLPTQYGKVIRSKEVKVKYIDQKGKNIIKTFDGLEATCLQHEIDHLDGKLFVDHLSKLKKSIILKKLYKYKKFKNQNN